MSHTLITIAMLVMACCYAGYAQQQTGQLAPHAMTYIEREMYKTSGMIGLKTIFDTLKTDYNRRYFLGALPAYCARINLQSRPSWVDRAVATGLKSKDPLYVYNAVMAAAALKINYSADLMSLYKAVHTTFGCHEDMLKSAILIALTGFDDADKPAFLANVLENDHFPLLSASFGALVCAMESAKNDRYTSKLDEYFDTLAALAVKLKADENQYFKFEQCVTLKQKVDKLRSGIGGN